MASAPRNDRVAVMTFLPPCGNASAEIAAQHQRRGAALIIAPAPPDVAEAGAAIQRTRGGVVLIDFEKHRPGAEPGEASQVQTEQRPGNYPPPLGLSDGV